MTENENLITTRIERIIYFDYLSVFATLGVIMLHVASNKWYEVPINSLDWKIMSFYAGIVRWCVPIFVMISGALFCNREITLKKLFIKYIGRLFIAYLVWSIIYYIYSNKSFPFSLTGILTGYYHLWYVPMLAGVYLCYPLLKQIAKSERLLYFIILSFVIMCFIPSIITFTGDFCNVSLYTRINKLNKIISDMQLSGVNYGFYFLLGYYVSSVVIFTKRQKFVIYILGIIGAFLTVFLNMLLCIRTQSLLQHYFENFSLNVLLMSLSFFVFFKTISFNNIYLNKIFAWLSKECFIIYLVHALILRILEDYFNITSMSFFPIISIPLLTLLIFGISLILSIPIRYVLIILQRTFFSIRNIKKIENDISMYEEKKNN